MVEENILVVDDDVEVRSLISGVLSDEGYRVQQAADEHEAILSLKKFTFSLIFLDLWIGEDESAGFKILNKIKKLHSEIPIVIISGHGTIDVAVRAIQEGAFDFLEKPFVIDRLLITAKRALEACRLRRENITLKNNKLDAAMLSVGRSPFVQSTKVQIEKIAAVTSRVLIKAEVGSGANVLAFAIHKESQRKGLFVYVNCLSDNREKFDSDLFGTEKSYGFIERAHGGTLYLEEISKLQKSIQLKLLDFFQNGYYTVGQRKVYSDVRVICSTSADLDEEIKADRFSRELLLRLGIIQVSIPSLAERKEDIVPLIQYFVAKSDVIFGLKKVEFSQEAISILQSFEWPGNVRQLQNVVESALINATGKNIIDKKCLPPELIESTKKTYKALDVVKLISLPLKEAKNKFESDYLKAQISRFSGNISKTANFIGMERSALHRKLKSLNVEVVRKKRKQRGKSE